VKAVPYVRISARSERGSAAGSSASSRHACGEGRCASQWRPLVLRRTRCALHSTTLHSTGPETSTLGGAWGDGSGRGRVKGRAGGKP
jgi:hypothetical protein